MENNIKLFIKTFQFFVMLYLKTADKISNNGQEPKRRRQTKKIQEDNQIQNALNKDLFQIIVKNNKLYNNDINANNSSTNIEETSNISLDKKTPSSTSFTDNADNVMYCMVPQQSYTIYLPDGSKHHTPIIFPGSSSLNYCHFI